MLINNKGNGLYGNCGAAAVKGIKMNVWFYQPSNDGVNCSQERDTKADRNTSAKP